MKKYTIFYWAPSSGYNDAELGYDKVEAEDAATLLKSEKYKSAFVICEGWPIHETSEGHSNSNR